MIIDTNLQIHPYSDLVTLERIDLLHPLVREEVHKIYFDICSKVATNYTRVRFSDTLRTYKEQDELYKIGRTKAGSKVTWVKGGYSFHNHGLAIDIVLIIDKDKNGTFESASWDTKYDGDEDKKSDWEECVKIFEAKGWQWGLINSKGERYDLPHFQKTFGYKASELKSMDKDEQGYPKIKVNED